MTCLEIEFGTPAYDELVKLRDDILRKPLGLEFTAEYLSKEYKMYHLACYTSDMELVGGLVLQPNSEDEIQMRQVAVSEQHQKKGIGTLLVQASEELAIEKGFKLMMMHARETAVPFYERLDYKKYGKRFTEVKVPHFKMKKEL